MSRKQGDIIKRLDEFTTLERKLAIEKALTFDKAFKSQDVNTILKAQQMYEQFTNRQNPMARQPSGLKSMIIDPLTAQSSMGFFNKPASVSWNTLRRMANTPIIRAIIGTRKDQVAEFLKPQPDKYSKGFEIVKVGQDKDEDVSDADRARIDELTTFLLDCGEIENEWMWEDFETFGRKIVDDSLVLDQAVFEVIPQRNFEPHSFCAVDGGTIRIADSIDPTAAGREDKKIKGCFPTYVQLYQGTIFREFYPWELCFGVRNPTTDITKNGYGRSELEDLIQTVTAMLNADAYNSGFFRQGAAPKGALLVKKAAGVDAGRLDEFRNNWNAMMAGVSNAHKTPILDAESFEWLDLHKNNKDMEFSQFQEYLIKISCAVYKISPEEVGFSLKKTGSLGNDSGEEEKKYSVDKGLKPLLSKIQAWINKYIIGPKTNKQFRFQFVGLDIESAKEEEERINKAVTTYITPDEVRKEKGLKPLPGGAGKLPLNPIYMQMKQMEQQTQMEDQQRQEEQDNEQFTNTNPFLDDETGEETPMTKGFSDWYEQIITAK